MRLSGLSFRLYLICWQMAVKCSCFAAHSKRLIDFERGSVIFINKAQTFPANPVTVSCFWDAKPISIVVSPFRTVKSEFSLAPLRCD